MRQTGSKIRPGAAIILSGGLWLSACATTSGGQQAPKDEPDLVSRLQKRAEAQSARISELETRLSLLEAEWRKGRNLATLKPRDTVVIGSTRPGGKPPPMMEAADGPEFEPETAEGPRPTLILDERRAAAPAPKAMPGMPALSAKVPAGLPGLGVVAMPAARAKQAAADPVGSYREALELVHARRFDAALVALSSFLGRFPTHALADRALYWRGEVEYAQREYSRALSTFDELRRRFPQSDKRAHALLKAGFCHRRLGDDGAARAHFQQVRTEFPDSEAARLAPGEGAS